MAFGKRQVILAALVVALGAAVYLNWQFSDNKNLIATNITQSTRELGEARYVNNVKEEKAVPQETKIDDTQIVKAANMSEGTSEFFAQAKINRQKARDSATDMAKEILGDIKASESAKSEAVKQAADIAKNIQQESNIESLIKAKGFNECVAFIQNGECSVVVSPDGVNQNLAIAVKDIVSGQAGIAFDKIKIVEAK